MGQINYSELFAEKILNAMFDNYDFDFTISTPDDDLIYFEIETNNINYENNQIELHLEQKGNEIHVKVYKRSEDYEDIGYYDIEKDKFYKSSSFWETMFTEHLLF